MLVASRGLHSDSILIFNTYVMMRASLGKAFGLLEFGRIVIIHSGDRGRAPWRSCSLQEVILLYSGQLKHRVVPVVAGRVTSEWCLLDCVIQHGSLQEDRKTGLALILPCRSMATLESPLAAGLPSEF